MKRMLLGLGTVISVLGVGVPFAFAAPPIGFQNQTLAQNLAQPTDFAFAPDGRIFITQKGGTVVVYKNGAMLPAPALTLSVTTGGDRGLLSLALDPNFSSNHFIYIAYTTSTSHERLSRFTMNGDTIDPASEDVLFENPEAWSGFLNATTLRYNPVDGKLYMTMGSNGGGTIAQDLSSLDGKVLRVNLDGSIPSDNPFVNTPGAQGLIWAMGFRNPWKMNIDQNGAPLVADVGENTWEEVDRIGKGLNYGWPQAEGTSCSTNCGGLTAPIFVYNHNGQSAAIAGGDVYKGNAFPAPYNQAYFYGDFIQKYINYLTFDGSGNVVASTTFDTGIGALAGINSGPDGCLYYINIVPGELHRYCYTATPPAQTSTTASTDASSYGAGQTVHASITATAAANLPNALIDVELWGPSGKIVQNVTPESFTAGVPVNVSWNFAAPSSSGNYTIKVGIFSSDWATLYAWNDAATTFAVTGSAPQASFNDSIGGAGTITAGSPVALSATISSTANITVNFDLELWNGTRVLQQVTPVSLTAGQAQTIPWNFTAPSTPGTYTVKAGFFSPDWTTLYKWDDTAGTLTVTSGSPQVAFSASASMPATSFAPGAGTTVTTNVAATAAVQNTAIDTEIYDANNNRVFQSVVPENLPANQQVSLTANITLPQTQGTYTVKIGIFSSDWNTLYLWQNRAFQFTIGTAPGTPQPGQTYPVTVLAPQDGQAVSGTVEVRAAIPSLDINSYDIWWETGNGALNDLETDPVALAYKHAWINFDAWTWMPNHQYPITFIAKDLSGNVIGSTTITVTH